MSLWIFVVIAIGVVAGSQPASGLEASGDVGDYWTEPVSAQVVDAFRLPRAKYGSGNRGLEYDTFDGQKVRAVDAGRVVFVGLVAGERHVVVKHRSGLKSTYAFLARTSVVRGQVLARGQLVGAATDYFHLTARLGRRYVDPARFLVGARIVRLIPSFGPILNRIERSSR